MQNLREALSQAVDEVEFAALSRKAQLARWQQQAQFCHCCASPLRRHAQEEIARECTGCGHVHYPPVSPCIIVLITKGDQCLLAHAANFAPGRYSTLAGFIEPGETAEQAVAREVREEVGIEVTNIRYFKSQSWPFPHSLMLGFFAEYAGGDLQPDGVEILAADWFSADKLPSLPPAFAISGQLIEHFLSGRLND
ncbi:NAD(+) diphosphatase [Nitrincola iocasae]|uniref:NAD(+) diphosphatase n=1 Tax=Nitrincola iocasae TaxID=2614693 RepID=A0A5J6LEM9_9GAMM|nr:NAD(+) diphosphatase [Nitrincola iocasae]QEW06776.1 NAD(+) diphosphatase [Nitrincola iocasae]